MERKISLDDFFYYPRIENLGQYGLMTFLMICFIILVLSSAAIAKRYFESSLEALLTLFYAFLFFIPYFLSVFGLLKPIPVLIMCASVTPFLLARGAIHFPKMSFSIPIYKRSGVLFFAATILFLAASKSFLKDVLWNSIRYIHPINTDALAGSLPNLIDMLQTGSLWTMRADYSHYLMGYEFIQSWGFLFLKSESLFGIVHYSFLGILIFYAMRFLALIHRGAWPQLTLSALLLLFPPLVLWVYGPFGKTDLPSMAFSVMSTYWCMRYFLNRIEDQSKSSAVLFFTGVSFALMVSVKPQALYLAFLLSIVILITHFKLRRKWTPLLLAAVPASLCSVMYYRLVFFGHPSFAELGMKTMLIRTILFPDFPYFKQLFGSLPGGELYQVLYGLNWATGTFYGSCLLCLALFIFRKQLSSSVRFINWMILINCIVFLISPLVVWYPTIHIRYSLALMPMLMVLATLMIFRAMDRTKFFSKKRRDLQVSFSSVWIFLALLLGIELQAATYQPKDGIEGYAGTYHDPIPSPALYRWVWDHIENKRIICIGPRGYGLYGKGYKNEIINSRNINTPGLGDGKERWMIGQSQWHADYLIYKRYHHDPTDPPNGPPKEVLEMAKAKDQVKLEFYDNASAVFRFLK